MLFLDVVGSTALTRQLDPEDLLDVMDGALKRFASVIDEHGGRVLQYAGDSVLAAFGADRAREDDAERAVRAGLALLAATREHAAKVALTHGVVGFDVRVGAHTGLVLLGGGVDEEGTIRGFTVNIAARMEQSAPVGALRISHDTWRQVRGAFEVQAQPPLQVKGQDEPLATYLVLAAQPRTFRVASRGIGDIETALVGREAELARLLSAFERAATGGGLQSVTLIADAGLGKSRLLHELQHRLDLHAQRCWLVLGRSHPGGMQQPFGLLRDMLAWRLKIADSDGADAARQRFVQGLQPFFAADGEEAALRQAETLGQLIGLDFSTSPRLAGFVRDARLLRDSALAAFATWLQRLAASDGSPVVVLLDDLQWADEASLDALLQLRERFELPLLLVLAARPALLERRADWGKGWKRHETLALAPLTESERQTLIRTLLRKVADLPETLLSQLDAQSEGNPYYAEELVLMLIDDGVIDTAAEPWRVRAERLVGARIPGTLIGVLQARLDALTAAQRRAMQAASIVGPVFWDEALSALDADATGALPALRDKAMVQARPESVFEGTREENFHHHLLHQVTYDTLLKAERRLGHGAAARWLTERTKGRSAEFLAMTGEHAERAGETALAIDCFEQAGKEAQKRFANSAAASWLGRALALLGGSDPAREMDLLHELSLIADTAGDRSAQEASHHKATAILERHPDDVRQARLWFSMALLADRRADYVTSLPLARQACELAERCGAAQWAAVSQGQLAWLSHKQRDFVGARHHLDIGLQWAGKIEDELTRGHTEGRLLAVSAVVFMESKRPGKARESLLAALSLGEALGSLLMQLNAKINLTECASRLGHYDEMRGWAERARVAARSIGAGPQEAHAMQDLGRAAASMGDHEAAVPWFVQSLALYRRLGDQKSAAELLMRLADMQLEHGAAKDALRWCAEARAEPQALSPVRSFQFATIEAHAQLRLGEPNAALATVNELLGRLSGELAHLPASATIMERRACQQVLEALLDPRAWSMLTQLYADVHAHVAELTDAADCDRLIQANPGFRDIVAAHQRRRLPD